MTQYQIILNALKENPNKEFTAKDFQTGKYFIGYEASARISELIKMYPDKVIAGKQGRFRTIKLNVKG